MSGSVRVQEILTDDIRFMIWGKTFLHKSFPPNFFSKDVSSFAAKTEDLSYTTPCIIIIYVHNTCAFISRILCKFYKYSQNSKILSKFASPFGQIKRFILQKHKNVTPYKLTSALSHCRPCSDRARAAPPKQILWKGSKIL